MSYAWRKFTLGVSIDNVFNDRSTTAIASPVVTTRTATAYYTLRSPKTYLASLKVKF
jgi:hypothetical protein